MALTVQRYMNILWTNGQQLEIFKLLDVATEQLPMEIAFMLLVAILAVCEYLKVIFKCLYFNSKFSPTEIWSRDAEDDTINMKIAEPTLYFYRRYPELFIVDSDFCTKN